MPGLQKEKNTGCYCQMTAAQSGHRNSHTSIATFEGGQRLTKVNLEAPGTMRHNGDASE